MTCHQIANGVVLIVTAFLVMYTFHCTWVTSEAYSSPSIVLSARGGDGSRIIFDDFREAYYWLRHNTPEVSVQLWRDEIFWFSDFLQSGFLLCSDCLVGLVARRRPRERLIWVLILPYLSCSLADRWGTAVDFTTSFLHSSRFSAFRSMIFHSRPVHSLTLSSHRFLCLPLRLPP